MCWWKYRVNYRVQAFIRFLTSTVLTKTLNSFSTFFCRFSSFVRFRWSSCCINLFRHFNCFGEDLHFILRFGFSLMKQVILMLFSFEKRTLFTFQLVFISRKDFDINLTIIVFLESILLSSLLYLYFILIFG